MGGEMKEPPSESDVLTLLRRLERKVDAIDAFLHCDTQPEYAAGHDWMRSVRTPGVSSPGSPPE